MNGNDGRAFDAQWRAAQQALQRGDSVTALQHLRACLSLRAEQPALWLQTAVTAFQCGQRELARELLDSATQRWPADVSLAFHRGYLCELGGDIANALAAYGDALAAQPDHIDSLRNRSLLLVRQGRHTEALVGLRRLLQLRPTDGALLATAAEAAFAAGGFDDAQAWASALLALQPDHPDGLRLLGQAARARRDLDTALPALRRAVELLPQRAGLLADLGQAEIDAAEFQRGCQHLQAARAMAPDHRLIDWMAELALPALMLEDEMLPARARFTQNLERIHDELKLDTPDRVEAAYQAICRVLPFPLHYLPFDNRELASRFGDLVERIISARAGELAQPLHAADTGSRRVRVGFVSAELREHTITRYFGRWLTQLDPQRFECWAWHCGAQTDATTAHIAKKVAQFRHMPLQPLQLAQDIRAAQLDVVVLLDVGMDPRLHALAAMRLAPRQYLAYGHPVTSGLSTLDGFLSGAALESAQADSHYREPLIRLPGLGAIPTRPALAPSPPRARRRGVAPELLCAQSLVKLIPAFDDTLAQIAAATGARLTFFTGPAGVQPLERRFLQRLSSAMHARNLDAQAHVQLVPRRDYAAYMAQVAEADLVLDSPWFSGGATSLDACHASTPIVTWEGEFLRARQTAGMLRSLGLSDTIAHSETQYIDTVVRLSADPVARDALAAGLRERANQLFDAEPGMSAFSDVLASGVPAQH